MYVDNMGLLFKMLAAKYGTERG